VTFHSKILIAGLLLLGVATSAAAVCPPDCTYMASPKTTRVEPLNIYSEIGSDKLSPIVLGALPRIYVPNHSSNTVSVIDPATHKVVDTYRVGQGPQHIIPSWDLKTLWVANTANQTNNGSMTPIDPKTGKPGKNIPVTDPYNMYFTPDGSSAIIVAEAYKKLDFRDPVTMALQYTINAPICKGINHADYSADYSFLAITCEFGQISLIKVDMKQRKVVSGLVFSKPGMPQDVRLSPDGKTFYVTDMMNDGVFLVDAETFKETGFIETGVGAHGLTTSRDGKRLYVGNRGSNRMPDKAGGKGSVSVIEFATNKVVAQWPIPGGGSPDMGNVTADGKELWLAGRYDGQVYAIDTTTGAVIKINVGIEPHGLTVWPQPGRFSLGHTGNMR
jgi:YVTN family beta-propeller protein